MKQTRLIVISAPSAAGKTTLCTMLLKEYPQIARSISVTTRPKRDGEKEGVDYFFETEKRFQERKENGEFVETAFVHNHWYGTLKQTIDNTLNQGKHVLFSIDVQGAMSLKKLYGNRVLLIFVHPPSVEVLQQRLWDRAENNQHEIETRLQNAYNEMEWSKKFHYQILNDDLTAAFKKLKEIIQKECLK